MVGAVLSLFLLVTKRLYGKEGKWSRGQKKTCRKKQHVRIDDMKEMSDLICGKAAVGGNYNSTRDTTLLQEYSMQLGKIGSNLNQIARCFNQGFISDSLRDEVREACRELLNLKFRILPALEDVACGKKYQKKTKSTASGKESG